MTVREFDPKKELIFDLKVTQACMSCKRYGLTGCCPPNIGEFGYYKKLLGVVRPKVVIPIHWDNLFSASDPEPYFWPPALKCPPLRRINLPAFSQAIHQSEPDIAVIIPQPSKPYEASELVNNVHA